MNGGQCKGNFDTGFYECICSNGWTGKNCQSTQCTIDCGLHGTCSSYGNVSHCLCESGFTGPTCQGVASVCKYTCLHGGCVVDGDVASCLCEPAWTGDACNQLRVCTLNCTHGTCHFLIDEVNPVCICRQGWVGSLCEIAFNGTIPIPDNNDNNNNENNSGTKISTAGTVLLSLGLCSIVIGGLIFYWIRNRGRKDALLRNNNQERLLEFETENL